jgi:hypothetical protein
MKKTLFFFLTIAMGLVSYGQPAMKVFGFEQEVLPGTIPANVKDENGNTVRKAAAKKNYFIYLSLKKNCNITPQQVFIRGKAFTVETKQVKNTPVEYVNSKTSIDSEEIVLVPSTSNKVIELKINEPVGVKKSAKLKKLMHNNDLVISYVWKTRKYFTVLKQLKTLEPILNE